MMPHPERASEDVLGMKDGLKLLRSLVQSAALLQ
jgi:phosphoribosylformylglycinamidine (FGAM) synthase-like amidotransferase family enzyme